MIILTIIVEMLLLVPISLQSFTNTPYGSHLRQPQTPGIQTGSGTTHYGFSFPYTYEQPTVPKSAGVQGTSGPNVPLNTIGLTSQAGTTGHLGPVNVSNPLSMNSANSKVTLRVYNGSLSPLKRSSDVGATVQFQNISLYEFYTVDTSSSGFANFTLPEGWYYLTISQKGAAFQNFSQEIHVNSPVFSLVRYRMPTSNSTNSPINNGPQNKLKSGFLNIYSASGYPATQVTVDVFNGSLSGKLLFSAVTSGSGYVNYTGLSNSYTYYYKISGYSQTATGTVLGYSNTSGSFSAGGGVNIPLYGRTSWSASVSGAAPSQGYENQIVLTGNLRFTGGQVYLSAPFSTNQYNLVFVNSVVYFNSTVTYPNGSPNLYFINSTVYMFSNVNWFSSAPNGFEIAAEFNNSALFFSSVNTTALAYTAGNNVVGPWLVAASHNSIFESVHVSYTNSGDLAGTYVNSEFFRFNVTEQNPPNANGGGTLTLIHVNLTDSNLVASSIYANFSVLTGFGYPNIIGNLFIEQCYVVFNNWQGEVSLGGNLMVLDHTTVGAIQGVHVLVNPITLYSNFTFVNGTPTSVGLRWYSLTFSPVHAYFYDDYIYVYPNLSIRSKDILKLESGSYQGWGGITFSSPFMDMNYTLLYGMDSIGFFPPHYFDLNFSHSNFSNGWSDQEWNPFEWFSGVVTPQIPIGTFNNCTFYGMHYNPQIWWRQMNLSTDVSIGFLQNLNTPKPPTGTWGYVYMNYSNIYNVGIGTNDGYSFGMSEGGITTVFNDNVFYNDPNAIFSPVGTSGWYNGSYMQVPFANNIEHAAGWLVANGNWFLNLTNQTLPWASVIGSGGQGNSVGINMSGNHFFYYPNNLQQYLPVTPTPLAVPFDNNTHYSWPPNRVNRPTHLQYTFQFPVKVGGTVNPQTNDVQYVFNSTVLQPSPFSYTPNFSYAWVIEPDVNTSTGQPVISFQNGLVGGPMPNLVWNGSSYGLAVEKNMTYISAQSSSSPRIGLQFQVPVGLGVLDVWMYNSTSGKNQLVAATPESGNTSIVEITYNPAIMPLGAVFFTNTTAGYTVTFKETGLPPGTDWGVTLDGILSESSSNYITFGVTNGSYNFSLLQQSAYRSSIRNGTTIVQGSDITVNISWAKFIFNVSFNETGLDGQKWAVTLNNSISQSTNTSISFTMPNGTYTFAIQAPSNYTASPLNGSIDVRGSDTGLNIAFTIANSSTGTSPPPPPPSPPTQPPTSSPPVSSPQPTSISGSGYKLLIIQMVAITLAPGIVMSGYLFMHALTSSEVKRRPKKLQINFRKVRYNPKPPVRRNK